jgi:stage IV sporulation protein B
MEKPPKKHIFSVKYQNHFSKVFFSSYDDKNNFLLMLFIPFIFMFLVSWSNYSYAEEINVIPSGESVGVKLYTDGLLVIGISEVESSDGNISYPAKECGLKTNDIIEKANNIEIKTIEQFSEIVSKNPNGVNLTVKREEEYFDTSVIPVMTADGSAKIGIWVRDSTAGIGTVTYINPSDYSFAALGHGICDVDTGNILSVKSGNILNCSFLSLTKSEKGMPGELSGTFDNVETGTITKNTPNGIFGKINKNTFEVTSDAVPVASVSQVEVGNAYILSDIDGSGVKKYDIEIKKIYPKNNDKGIIFEVTDDTLKEKAGGIVQGMSGAPIIQNNMLVGAVTHVFVNNPERGYGIFAENMYNAGK